MRTLQLKASRSPAGPSNAGGFSLVELMVAIVLGLFLVIGLLSLIGSNSASRVELDKSSRQIENGRFALSLLTEDIEHAGFTGSVLPRTSSSVTQSAPTLCPGTMTGALLGYAAAANYVATLPYSVYSPTTMPGCISNRKSGTAVIAVSRASTSTATVGGAVSNVAYLQPSTCASGTIPFAVNPAASAANGVTGVDRFPLKQSDCATPALLRPLVQRIYFVSTCNICSGAAAENPPQPTLKMIEYDASGALQITPLVEGIEDLQFHYGIDSDGNGSPDSYVATPADWADVVTVRIHVLARNEFASAGWSETRTYDMGGAAPVGPFNDGYKRHVFNGVARLHNLSGQREVR